MREWREGMRNFSDRDKKMGWSKGMMEIVYGWQESDGDTNMKFPRCQQNREWMNAEGRSGIFILPTKIKINYLFKLKLLNERGKGKSRGAKGRDATE